MADYTITTEIVLRDLASEKLKQFSSNLKDIKPDFAALSIAGGSFVASLGLIGAKGISMSANLQASMANVASIAGVAEENIKDMTKTVSELSVVVPRTAQDLADGLYQVISAGIPAGDSMKVLEASAIAATAGLSDTFTAVDAITTILNSYSMSADKATEVSDVMFTGVVRGKMTFPELASAIGTVAAPAAQAGLSFETVIAALTTMTKMGISTSEAVTYLRQVIVSILSPTTEAKKTAEKLGIEFNATALASKGLSDFLEDVRKRTGEDSEALTNLFGNVRAFTGVLAISGKNIEMFNEDLTAMAEASGMTQKAYEEQSKSFTMQTTLMKNSVTAFANDAFMPFLDILSSVAKNIGSLFIELNKLPPGLKVSTVAILGLSGAFVALITMMSTVNLLFPKTAGLVVAFTTTISQLKAAVILLGNNLLSFIVSPIGVATLVIGGLTYKFLKLKETSDETFAGFGKKVKEVEGLAVQYNTLAEKVYKSKEELKEQKEIIKKLSVLLPEYSTKLGDLGHSNKLTQKDIDTMNQKLLEQHNITVSNMSELEKSGRWIMDFIVIIAKSTYTFWVAVIENLYTLTKEVFIAIKNVVKISIEAIFSAYKNLGDYLDKILVKIYDIFSDTFQATKNLSQGNLKLAQKNFEDLKKSAKEFGDVLKQPISLDIKTNFKEIEALDKKRKERFIKTIDELAAYQEKAEKRLGEIPPPPLLSLPPTPPPAVEDVKNQLEILRLKYKLGEISEKIYISELKRLAEITKDEKTRLGIKKEIHDILTKQTDAETADAKKQKENQLEILRLKYELGEISEKIYISELKRLAEITKDEKTRLGIKKEIHDILTKQIDAETVAKAIRETEEMSLNLQTEKMNQQEGILDSSIKKKEEIGKIDEKNILTIQEWLNKFIALSKLEYELGEISKENFIQKLKFAQKYTETQIENLEIEKQIQGLVKEGSTKFNMQYKIICDRIDLQIKEEIPTLLRQLDILIEQGEAEGVKEERIKEMIKLHRQLVDEYKKELEFIFEIKNVELGRPKTPMAEFKPREKSSMLGEIKINEGEIVFEEREQLMEEYTERQNTMREEFILGWTEVFEQTKANFYNFAQYGAAIFNSLYDIFRSNLKRMIMEGNSFKDTVKAIWDDIKTAVISAIAEMIAQWLALAIVKGIFRVFTAIPFQTKPGEYKVVPGSPAREVPAIVHGGEVIMRPPVIPFQTKPGEYKVVPGSPIIEGPVIPFQTKPGEYKVVPGSPIREVPAIVHGGEVIMRPPAMPPIATTYSKRFTATTKGLSPLDIIKAGQQSNVTVNISAGTVLGGNEGQLKEAIKKLFMEHDLIASKGLSTRYKRW